MFQAQEESADYEYPRGPLKRYHEEEAILQANGSTIGFTEHRNKRLQTLPLRTSPTAPRGWSYSQSDTPFEGGQQRLDHTMTPPGSFSEVPPQAQKEFQQDDANYASLQQRQSNFSYLGSIPAITGSGDLDMDTAMDDMIGSTSHATYEASNCHIAPEYIDDSQGSTTAGCSPTSLPPSFAVRGNNWGGAAGNIMQSNNSMANSGVCSVSRSLEHPGVLGEWSMTQNRSLPSPISDSGAFDDQPGQAQIEGCGDHDSEIVQNFDPTAAMLSSPLPMAASSPIRGSNGGTDSDPAATPSPRKGHTRSRHTIVAWTAQPGMKRAFTIGYRADCEKCVNRVPGHFNHIIVS
ncbi:hypothetical protein SEPCBS57363_001121 [Sporothrix epigloea]|uniref:Uncharacterized protein n=1 Tax=Sporothrix epigloea TaxID=1892477 RepID=A0ABP0D8J3_9PEZI